jgi:hypothetical protein
MLWPEALLAITAVICFTSIAHGLIEKSKGKASPKTEDESKVKINSNKINEEEWLD